MAKNSALKGDKAWQKKNQMKILKSINKKLTKKGQQSMDIDALIGASEAMNSTISEVIHTQNSRNVDTVNSQESRAEDGTGQELFVLKRLFQER